MSNWGCPHEVNEKCTIAEERPCKPGIRGCILHGRFTFSNSEKKLSQNRSKKTDRNPLSKKSNRKK